LRTLLRRFRRRSQEMERKKSQKISI